MPKCETRSKSGYSYRAFDYSQYTGFVISPAWEYRSKWKECGGKITLTKCERSVHLSMFCTKCGTMGSVSNIKALQEIWSEIVSAKDYTHRLTPVEIKEKKEIKRAINIEELGNGEMRNKNSKE